MSRGSHFFVLAKNLKTTKWKKIKSTELYNINDKCEYWAFHPCHAKDFVEKTEYGCIEDHNTKGKLMTSSKVAKTSARGHINNDIVATFIAKNSESHPDSGKSYYSSSSDVQNKHKLAQLTKQLETAREELAGKNLKISALEDVLNELLEAGKHTEDKLQIKEVIKEIEDKIFVIVTKLQNQLNQLLDLKSTMLQNNEKLIKELAKELADKVLTVITDGLSEINKENVDNRSIYKHRNAVDPENVEFHVPKGKIYIGHEQFINEKDVRKIEENVFRFTTRVDKLCNLIWENEVHNVYCTENMPANGRRVTSAQSEAITNILRNMKWLKEEKCVITHDMVNRQIQKYASYCRQQKKFKALPIEEQKAIKCERARKNKERMKTNNGGKKFVIKKRKRIFLKNKPNSQKQKLDDNKKPNEENSTTGDESESTHNNDSDGLSEVERTEDETDYETE